LANGGGDYLSPSFSVWNVDGLPNSTYPAATHWQGTADNYTTAVVGNLSIAWIQKVVQEDPSRPFFAYVAPKAAHEPFNPAPWYAGHWDPSWPAQEPRPINWNCSAEMRANHHGNIATQPMLTEDASTVHGALSVSISIGCE
jgi:arylsulfatase A-like enzyme